MKTMNEKEKNYTVEDLNTDIAWLGGYGIGEEEAKAFLSSLVFKRPTAGVRRHVGVF